MTELDTEDGLIMASAGYPETCPHCQKTLIHPDQLDENLSRQQIWRRHRRVHFGWGNVPEEEEGKYLSGGDGGDGEDGLPEDCKLDTQTYTVEFHYEYVEQVTVEAATKAEARRFAEEEATYQGELVQTLHTDQWTYGEPSQASQQYLELVGLLPDDWDGEINV